MHMPPNPFQWEVTLVQSTQPVKESVVLEQAAAQPIGATQTSRPAPTSRMAQTPLSHARTTSVQPTVDTSMSERSNVETLLSAAQTVPQTEPLITDSTPSVHQTADAARQQPDPLPNKTIQEPSAPTTTETPSHPESGPVSDPVPLLQTHVMASAQSSPPSSPQTDYSWLQRMIFQRLEQLKRSSRPQLDEGRPLKVLVKAVVSNDGNLLASEVVKSSGLQHIDQEAIALVQRAFPMQFEHPLDRQQVAMRIPITYSRE